MKKSLIAVLMTVVISLSLVVPLISTVKAVESAGTYTTVNGVLASDYYILYPFEAYSLNVGFSKYGELIGIPAGADQSVQANWVGLEYGSRDPFCPVSVVPITSWINGWYCDIQYIDPALSGVKRDRHLWAFAMFSDGFGFDGDWASATTPGSNPGHGRQTNGYCVTDPLTVLYDGPREYIAISRTHIYDKEGAVTWPVVDVCITLRFDKVMKEVTLYKDIKLVIPKMHLWGKLDVQFSNREEYDLGPANSYDSYAHFYRAEGVTSYGPDWEMAQNLLRENVTHFSGTGSKTQFVIPTTTLAADFMKVWVGGVFADPSTYTVDVGAKTLTFGVAPASGKDIEIHYKYVFATPEEWDGVYDIAQIISSDGAYVAWSGMWPLVSDWTVDGILRYLDPLVMVGENDCITGEPKQSPLLISEWDFLMDHTDVPQFRCVEVKGVAFRHDAQDSDHGDGNVIDREAMYQLDSVFLPWDLYNSVEKETKRWVEWKSATSSTSFTTHIAPGLLVPTSEWDQYGVFSERIIAYRTTGPVLLNRWWGDYSASLNANGQLVFTGLPANTKLKILYSTRGEVTTQAAGLTQVGLCLDDSGSISAADWTIIANGVASAVANVIPHDGSVELTVVQFSDTARVALSPTIITAANYAAIAASLAAMPQQGGLTAMPEGLNITWMLMYNSANFATATRQIINVATDGGPNVQLNTTTTDPSDPYNQTTYIRDLAASQGLDEIDAEAIGAGADVLWMREGLALTSVAPPYNTGWVQQVTDATAFAEAMQTKFAIILGLTMGRYEWVEVGRDAQAVDNTGAALVAEAFDSYKGIGIGISGNDMFATAIELQCPSIMSKFGVGTEGSNYKDTLGRAALADDWCTYWPIASSNIIGVGGLYANLFAYYANDFEDAFFGTPGYAGSTYSGYITGIPCWNRGWFGDWNVYSSNSTVGYAVISTTMDINGTVLFNVWGHWGRDTYYACQWLHGDAARDWLDSRLVGAPAIEELQLAPRGLTSIIVQIYYGTDPSHPTYTVVECEGTISETLWYCYGNPNTPNTAYGYDVTSPYKGGIHDP
jgi:hypothetical protein